ncbi:MAG: UDP-N-acetylmuramoyl-tripeptide--D-alanyl-D-alanine ligase [Spirochaetota bacterium]|nr:UDP-N-acetylmuramoyl-tripeptide--D-alanyl-D-alanine ligase [Spirochaetota bacterium]
MESLLTLAEVRQATGAELHNFKGDPRKVIVEEAAVDSRAVHRGSLFVALKGDRTDGHLYLEAAERNGAAAAVVSRDFFQSGDFSASAVSTALPLLVHDDPLTGLQQLASTWIDRFPELVKIGITGSNGKTTTKEILASILSAAAPTVKNQGNLNSEIGLPLAALHIRDEHRYGVFEMGVNHHGEMDQMVRVLRPHHGVITNVGTAHIGLLGNRDGIAREKGKLFSAIPAEGFGFYPESFEWLELYREICGASLVPFGRKSTGGVGEVRFLGLKGWEIEYEGIRVLLPLPGNHNLDNAMAAIQTARTLGISREFVKSGIEHMVLLDGRSQIIEGPVTIVHDGYNANAESMLAIFDTLSQSVDSGSLVVVLGSMKELGDSAEAAHRQVGRGLAELAPRAICLFGEEMGAAWDEVRHSGYAGELKHTEEFDELKEIVDRSVQPGDTVLLKGSRSMELERLIPDLQKLRAGNAG